MAVTGGGGNSKPMPGDPSNPFIEGAPMSTITPEEIQNFSPNWYFSKEEIEKHSPSRKDGIDAKKESQLRRLYCSFLHQMGMKLKVPQVTIAAAMVLCHRFYLRQSHTRNDWQMIATVSMFLACKAEETPRFLRDIVIVAYELIYKWDPSASRRIRLKEVYEQQKELVLIGERLLLATIAFDLNIQLPYKPLVAALKNLGLYSKLSKIAWNFVNDWLCTTLCLQYKPHYIAAGCVYLAAKFQNVKLPSSDGKFWWMEFDISPMKLKEVIHQMLSILGQDKKEVPCPKDKKLIKTAPVAAQTMNSSQQSCVTSGSSSSSDDHNIDGVGTHESKVLDSSNNGKCTLNSSTEDIGSTCQARSAFSGTHEYKVTDCSNNGKCTLGSSIENVGLTCQEKSASRGTHEPNVPDCSSNGRCNLNSSTENVGSTCQTGSAFRGTHESIVTDGSNNGKCTLDSSTEHVGLTCQKSSASRGTHEPNIPECSSNGKCILNSSTENVGLICQTSGASSGIRALEESNSIVQPKIEQGQSLSTNSGLIRGIDISRIRELKRKKRKVPSESLVESMNFEIGSEAWLEREIEMGIQMEDFSFAKKQRKEHVSILSL